jgi:site-specific recombinase XerD
MLQEFKRSDLAAHVAADPRLTGLAAVPDLSAWQTWLDSWMVHLRGRNLSDKTISSYVDAYKRLVRWVAHEQIAGPLDVRRRHLEQFLASERERVGRTGRQISPATIAMTHTRLKLFFGWLADEEDAPDPTSKLAAPIVPERRIAVLSDEELRRLLATCRGRDFTQRRDTAIIRVLLDAGIRRAEVTAMVVDDVDRLTQTAIIHGKGRRDRVVAIGTHTTEALDRYLRSRARHRDHHLDELWLAAPPHRGHLGDDGIRQLLERRGRDAGIVGLHAHQLRHTAYHAAKLAGLDDASAMAQFGWKDRAMLDHYAAITAETRAIHAVRRLRTGDRL